MKQAIRKTLALAAFGAAGLVATGAAHAGGVNWHIGINLPGVFYPQPQVVYAPPPPVVYAPPPPVYYRPAPIVYQPPVVVVQPYPRGYWRDGRWHDHGHRGHPGQYQQQGGYERGYQDRNGDGRPDRVYYDRNGDGRPDRPRYGY